MKIALCGFEGSGKDTIAGIMRYNYSFQKLSFGSALKDVLSSIFGWNREMLEGLTTEDRAKREIADEWWSRELGIPNFSPRIAMQLIGTQLFRDKFDPNIWTNIIKRKIDYFENIVITDARFPNEIKMLKEKGFKLFYVDRNTPEWFTDYKNGKECEEADLLHESQKMWIREEFDGIINNNGSIEELEINIHELFYC